MNVDCKFKCFKRNKNPRKFQNQNNMESQQEISENRRLQFAAALSGKVYISKLMLLKNHYNIWIYKFFNYFKEGSSKRF